MRRVTSCLVVALLVVASPRAQVARHVAAPPEDITSGRLVLPDPAELATTSRSAVLELSWRPDGDAQLAELDVPVDAAGPLALALVGVGADAWTWTLAAPGAPARDVRQLAADASATGFGAQAPGLRIEPTGARDPRTTVGLLLDAAPAGRWTAFVRAPRAADLGSSWLVVRTAGADEVALVSHLGTLARLSDRPIAVVARLDTTDAGVGLTAFAGVVAVESSGGRWLHALLDDGLHGDGAAGDGTFGAWIGPLPPGPARAAVRMEGLSPRGAAFVRTAHHAFTVEAPAARLSGTVTSEVLDDARLALAVGLQPLGAPARLHVSAEVWGATADGTEVPVAWLSRIEQPAETLGASSVALHLHGAWLARAGVTGALTLRRVRVQDPDSHVVYDALDALPVPGGARPRAARGAGGTRGEITPEMLLGPTPTGMPVPTLGATAGVDLGHGAAPGATPGLGAHPGVLHEPWHRALMLSHGYCSGGAIWPPADFAEPKVVFLDPDQNRTNDQFAQLLAAKGTATGKDSYGLVAHSQGGLASLHLLTYYQSGLDYALGPRKIQSVASPYQGTPLASLGFFACGVNDDMTTSGAPVWLAGIPTWARDEVFYWTTQNSGSACNFFTNLVLSSPNDGTVEVAKGQLPGAHNMGNKVGWCHTTGMSNPANYTDHVRNAEMDAQAAR